LQVRFFADNGFVRIKDLLPPSVLAAVAPAIDAEVAAAAGAPPLEDDDLYAAAFAQVINLWQGSDAVRDFVLGRRLARVAAQLMGVAGCRLYHDQALFKAPTPDGDADKGHTPWHCDQFYWPLDTDRTVTAWVPLSAVPPQMGPLQFAARSHRADLGRSVGIGKESDAVVGAAVREGGYELCYRGSDSGYELGEVSFHSGWTFHRADANRSESVRRVMTMIYIDKDARATEPQNDNQRADFARYLEGVEPGGICDGPLTPLVWER
jgi:ectoine hydroxylase-related dioxygenase (phytanoyl-CoA dioxygenase family)